MGPQELAAALVAIDSRLAERLISAPRRVLGLRNITMKFAQHHRSLALWESKGWGEGTIRDEATFHHPGWLGSPHDR